MISIIAVIGQNRELGCNNRLLWDLPQDMQRFRRLTLGHPVIMGRLTYESIGRALPDRTNIVITSNPKYEADDCLLAQSLDQAIALAEDYNITGRDEIFIIGGAKIYEQALGRADKLYLTLVSDAPPADVFFPPYPEFKHLTKEEIFTEGSLNCRFLELRKLAA